MNVIANPNLIYTRYPVLRSALREDFDRLDDGAFANTIEEAFAGWNADELEINFSNLGRSLSRGLGQVGNVAARAAPGALTGAMQGATAGAALGPYGMLAGAALGAVGGGISSYNQSRQQRRPSTPQRAPQPAPAAPPRPAYAPVPAPPVPQVQQQPALPSQQAMIGQLLQVLARPEVIQALLALSAGSMGRTSIPVGTTSAAPEDIIEVIGFTLRGGQADHGSATEGYGLEPGAEILNALETSLPDDHPFGQTLAMVFDAGVMDDADALGDLSGAPQEFFGAQEPASYTSLSPEYV